MKNLLCLCAAILAVTLLASCNTMRGFGEDISALGRSLSNATGTGSAGH